MKVLIVNKLYAPWIGGVEKVVQQVAEGLNGKNGFDIKVLACQPQGQGREEIINKVKAIKASSLGIFWGLPVSFDFLRLFKKLSQEVDLIDFHHPFLLGDLALFLFKPKAKLIVHYHSDIVRQKSFNFLLKSLIFHTLKKAQRIIVSSPNILESSPYLKNFREKCEVIPFGIDLEKIQKENNLEEIKKIRGKYGENLILFVGRLNYYKGLEYLIEAMKNIEAKLVIIGEGPERKNLEFRIRNLELENKIFLLPFQNEGNLINYYRACQVFVLPSIFKSEAFGLVLLEAMTCGKPVISTELGTGTSFVNRDGVTGFVVPPKDSEALAKAIRKILENQKMAQEFGQNAYQKVIEEFSLEQMLERIQAVYRNI